ncbi:MAG: aldo/keto reductase [Ignavibacteriaceae bacterium]|nr:aldo/keto reductase [Ignavibacteriaceae bacterium]
MNYKTLGKTGRKISVTGFGTYRVSYMVRSHEEALTRALSNGVNLIDTSANYTDGGSEMLIGNVVNKMVVEGEVKREDLVIVSKGGYLQGGNLESARDREIAGNPYSEVVVCAPDLWHCIHPDFLNDQISHSLERLKMDYIDVYLLHNPEYFLNYSVYDDEGEQLNEYYYRIQKAFEYLEAEVARGRIRSYGISSNTFGVPANEGDFTSLERILSLAHHSEIIKNFSVIQFSMNLMERGGWANLNQAGGTKNVLTLAAENNLGVLINRPLNGIKKDRLFRLAEFEVTEDRTEEEVDLLIESVKAKEIELKSEYVVPLQAEPSEKRAFVDCLSTASLLAEHKKSFHGVTHFNEINSQFLIPKINYVLSELDKKYDSDSLRKKLNSYGVEVQILLDSFRSILAGQHNKKLKAYHKEIDKATGGIYSGQPLSRKAVAMLNSLPQVSATLIGMRNIEYVDDMLAAGELEAVVGAEAFWEG